MDNSPSPALHGGFRARLIRLVGALQFRIPAAKRLIRACAAKYAAREGTIRHGIGAGLRFNATGGNAGYLFGTTEPEEQDMLARVLQPGGVLYDIGANIGFYSTLAARLVGPTGQVYAFEPFPGSANQIRHNAAINQFDNVTVVQAAVFNAKGSMRLHLGTASRGHRLAVESEEADGVTVDTLAIDTYLHETGARPPTVVMIDVEGAELAVLEGMLETLRAHRPTIMCEVHWLGSAFSAFCSEVLAPLGYQSSTLEGNPLPEALIRYHAVLRVP